MDRPATDVIVGLGNEIARDDGVGIFVAKRLEQPLAGRVDVDVVPLPWAGFALLDVLTGRRRAVLVDCLVSGRHPPGTLVHLDEGDFRGSVRLNSFHDIDFPTVLALGPRLGWTMPEEIAIWAIEGAVVDEFGDGLSPGRRRRRAGGWRSARLPRPSGSARHIRNPPFAGSDKMKKFAQPPSEPGVLPETEHALRQAFLDEVDRIPGGELLNRCIQCGTCSGSCPVTYAMDYSPRQVIAMFRAGAIEPLLRSRTIWICASCYHCTARCPANIKITDLLYALKRIAIEKKVLPKKFPVYALSENFADMVKRYGRNFETGLLLGFYLKTAPLGLLKMAPDGFALWRRGRIPVRPRKIRSIEGLRRIIAKAETFDRPQELVERDKRTDEVGDQAIGMATERPAGETGIYDLRKLAEARQTAH